MNRRQFLAYGTANFAFVSVANAAVATGFAQTVKPAISPSILFDQGFSDSRYFARQVARCGAVPSAIQGDVTALWHEELHPRWRQGRATVAGLTTKQSLFCIEQLASNHWMSLQFLAEHRYREDGCVEHRLFGTKPFVRCATALLAQHVNWQVAMAELVSYHSSKNTTQTVESILITPAKHDVVDHQPLVSWVIAANHAR